MFPKFDIYNVFWGLPASSYTPFEPKSMSNMIRLLVLELPKGWGPGNTWMDEGETPSGTLRSSGVGTVKDLRRRCRHIIIIYDIMHAYITHLENIEI